MTQFSNHDGLKSGVPMGGMGAGKLEMLPSGVLNAFSFQNNWPAPLSGNGDYEGLLGYHLGLTLESEGKPKKSFLLQTVPVKNHSILKNIRYEGLFPKSKLFYEIPESGVEVSLELFSPWLPGDTKNSSLPTVYFNFEITNKKKNDIKVGFIFIGRNICGQWCVGRKNRITEDKNFLHLEFSNEDTAGNDVRQGSLRFSFEKDAWETTFMESWNAVTQNFSFNSQTISLLGWDTFIREGELPNTKPGTTARGENQELCGAVASSRILKSKEIKHLSFAASWYFPNHSFGHHYENWFKNVSDVANYALPKQKLFRNKVQKMEELVLAFPFPRWFNESLLINLAPFFASTWFVKDGRFAFYEAPSVCPLMGTLDVGFYGSIPLAYFFPELEISQMRQFAKAQRPDGYIPHDLGKDRIDMASDGTTFYQWKDLNPKFVLMLYRDFLWSGKKDFLRALYPHAKKAILWSLKTDTDGNGLPDNEGADQTFDLWYFYGTNAYTSSLFLASLLAMEKMAKLNGDDAFAKSCRGYFLKGSASFEKELWNGKYFGQTCSLSQLNGQWYADLLGLEAIVDRKKIKTALESILRYNTQHSPYGMVNSVMANQALDTSNNHAKNIWGGMNYAFASLGLMEGIPLTNLLKELHKMWDNVTRVQKNPWNQPDMVDSKTGQFLFGDFYYRNMAIWSIPIAHAIKDKKTAQLLKTLKKSIQ